MIVVAVMIVVMIFVVGAAAKLWTVSETITVSKHRAAKPRDLSETMTVSRN